MKVFKYPLNPTGLIVLNLPQGAKPLHVSLQHERLCLWTLVDPDAPMEKRYFRLVGTGHEIAEAPERLRFVNTFFVDGGNFVFHLFEISP